MHGVTMKLCSSWYQTYIGTLLNSYLVSPAKNGRARYRLKIHNVIKKDTLQSHNIWTGLFFIALHE